MNPYLMGSSESQLCTAYNPFSSFRGYQSLRSWQINQNDKRLIGFISQMASVLIFWDIERLVFINSKAVLCALFVQRLKQNSKALDTLWCGYVMKHLPQMTFILKASLTEVLLDLRRLKLKKKKKGRLLMVKEQPSQESGNLGKKVTNRYAWKEFLKSQRHLKKLLQRSRLNSIVWLKVFFKFLILCRKLKAVSNRYLVRVCYWII